MNLGLEGKVALVTGGAKGIGAAVVRSFFEEGAQVAILDRNPEIAQSLINEIGCKKEEIFCVPSELTEESACREAVEKIIQKTGRIDHLIHNAGTNDGVGLDSTPESFFSSLRKNLIHVFSLTHYSLDELIKNKGSIVNIGSKVAVTGQGGTSGYAASKGAINALTREWALDLADKGVRVNAVIPAEVMTPMYRRWLDTLENPQKTLRSIEENIPLGKRMTTDQEIADSVVFLASSRSSHTTGQIIYPDGGYAHLDRSYGKILLD